MIDDYDPTGIPYTQESNSRLKAEITYPRWVDRSNRAWTQVEHARAIIFQRASPKVFVDPELNLNVEPLRGSLKPFKRPYWHMYPSGTFMCLARIKPKPLPNTYSA